MNQHDFNTLLIDFVRDEEVLYQSQNLNFTNSAERHQAYERIGEKLRQHGASYDQTHRLNEKFLKLKWRYMKEHQQVEQQKRDPSWPYYESLSFLLPSVLELERKRLNNAEDGPSRQHDPPPPQIPPNPTTVPPQQYVEVQACEVLPSSSSSNGTKGRATNKRKNVMMDETDTRLMEKRRITNQAFADFVACKLDEMPEPIRTYTERQIIDVVMSVHVETYQEISHPVGPPLHHNERDMTITENVYHPNNVPDQTFEHIPPAIPTTVRPRATRTPRKPKNDI